MGYHYNLAQLISLQVVDGDSVLLCSTCNLQLASVHIISDYLITIYYPLHNTACAYASATLRIRYFFHKLCIKKYSKASI